MNMSTPEIVIALLMLVVIVILAIELYKKSPDVQTQLAAIEPGIEDHLQSAVTKAELYLTNTDDEDIAISKAAKSKAAKQALLKGHIAALQAHVAS